MATGFIDRLKRLFEGDAAVARVAEDPTLSAELMLLFRMVLADGEVAGPELETFQRICREALGIDEKGLEAVMLYLQDFGYELTEERTLETFAILPRPRRVNLARHMAQIAKSDAALSPREVELLKRAIVLLGVEPHEVVGGEA